MLLKKLDKLADTIERFFTVPYIHGPKWARRQADHYRAVFNATLQVAPQGLEKYTKPIKARVDALPWSAGTD